jgi:putative nucleotidyltransferase with HDIG domain
MDVTLTRRIIPATQKKEFKPLPVDSFIAELAHLPAAFELIPRLLLLLDDPEADCDAMADIIRIDPGLTANVFRIANSARCGANRKAASLTEAILRLGMREVYRLVIHIVTSPALKMPDAFTFGRIDLWRHSLAAATAAQVLARHAGVEDPEVVFTTGLLHDIGKTVLSRLAEKEYSELLQICAETNGSVQAAESEAFLTDHTEVAGRLLRAWKIPERMVAAVAGHHSPAKVSSENRALAALVYVGNVMAYRIGQGNGFPIYAVTPNRAALELVGLEGQDLSQFEEEIVEMLNREQARLACGEAASR